MQTTAGLTVPAGSDAFDPQGDMVNLANSLRSQIVVPVVNLAARAALVAAIGWTPTAGEPLRVCRADARVGQRDEITYNGTDWETVQTTSPATDLNLAPQWDFMPGYACQVRRIGTTATVEGTRLTRTAAGGASAIAAGSDYYVQASGSQALPADVWPRQQQEFASWIHYNSPTPVPCKVFVGADGRIGFRAATGGTLGVLASNVVALPPMSWQVA